MAQAGGISNPECVLRARATSAPALRTFVPGTDELRFGDLYPTVHMRSDMAGSIEMSGFLKST
jgi:hypothetical protein